MRPLPFQFSFENRLARLVQQEVNVRFTIHMLLEHYEVAKAMPVLTEPFPVLLDFALNFIANGIKSGIANIGVGLDGALSLPAVKLPPFRQKPVRFLRLRSGHCPP